MKPGEVCEAHGYKVRPDLMHEMPCPWPECPEGISMPVWYTAFFPSTGAAVAWEGESADPIPLLETVRVVNYRRTTRLYPDATGGHLVHGWERVPEVKA